MILIAVPLVALCADLAFEIPPIRTSINIANQPFALSISGDISGVRPSGGETEQPFRLNLHADLADFQSRLTAVLQGELNQSDRCGERISIDTATLVPAAPAGRLNVQLHFEKWVCFKAFGKENAKRLLGGNGTVGMLLTPRVEDGNTVRLDAEVGDVAADGSLGEALRSGSVGEKLREKIREALLKAVRKSTDLEAVVPAQARPFVTIESIAFADGGGGRLLLHLHGRLMVPTAQIASMLEQFRSAR